MKDSTDAGGVSLVCKGELMLCCSEHAELQLTWSLPDLVTPLQRKLQIFLKMRGMWVALDSLRHWINGRKSTSLTPSRSLCTLAASHFAASRRELPFISRTSLVASASPASTS